MTQVDKNVKMILMKELLLRNKWIILIIIALIGGYWWGSRPRVVPLIAPESMYQKGFEIDGGAEEAATPDVARSTIANNQENGSPSERLIIKTANLSLLVKNVRESLSKLQTLAESLGGFVTHSDIYEVDEKKETIAASITFRVPAEKFNEALETCKKQALKVKSENITGQDVTEEYTDLQSRLKNLEATEEQLLQIMRRAGGIKDVLEVQRELNAVRGQIEQTKGRIKYLEESAQLASLTVYLATKEEELPLVEEGWKPMAAVKSGLRSLIKFWQVVADKGIYWTIFLSPFIFIGIIIWLLKKLRRSKP
ncbi:MAG: DUF4349 domain-containing protein [Candidatus Cloacimonetes bacterium]|nr:DUF4349 domain-containing protein [Candidatus Cloacimonadota bacterium]